MTYNSRLMSSYITPYPDNSTMGYEAMKAPGPLDRLLALQRITHGRHCTCSPCRREDWTNPDLAPCGMHGEDCPALYQPWGPAGSYHCPGYDHPRT